MTDFSCNVCGSAELDLLFESSGTHSLTSLWGRHPGTTRVRACKVCGHLQSDEFADEGSYYDQNYNILSASEEEDWIYMVRDNVTIYRTDHQVHMLLEKLNLPRGVKLLDYGCAKSSTVRALLAKRPDIEPFLFDVSEHYVPFWEKFVPPGNWATYQPKAEWAGKFDVVTSFFSLEHITDLAKATARIFTLLRPGGLIYAIIPNVVSNIADFIVVDHVNHFTATSLRLLFARCGMKIREIDDESHRGAFIVIAEKISDTAFSYPDSAEVAGSLAKLRQIGVFWSLAPKRMREFEESLPPDAKLAVYGAGFYGAFIAANLKYPDQITCYLDQNPFYQGKPFNGKPVISPGSLPTTVNTLLIGLNPKFSQTIIADIPALAARQLNYFFL